MSQRRKISGFQPLIEDRILDPIRRMALADFGRGANPARAFRVNITRRRPPPNGLLN
jgi:hypothetical protein